MQTDKLIDEISKNAKPVKRLHSPFFRVSVWGGLTFLVIFLLLPLPFVGGVREDIDQKMLDPIFLMEMGAILVAGFCAVLAALSLSVPDDRPRILENILIAVSIVVWITLVAVSILFSTTEEVWAEFQRTYPGFYCSRNVIIFGMVPAVGLIYMLKKSAPTHLGLVCFLAVLGAFSFGVFGCRLHYGDVAMYVLIWQYSPAIIAAIFATILGRRLLHW